MKFKLFFIKKILEIKIYEINNKLQMDAEWDPNASIVCPYDNQHIISVKRYQHHIIKCRKV